VRTGIKTPKKLWKTADPEAVVAFVLPNRLEDSELQRSGHVATAVDDAKNYALPIARKGVMDWVAGGAHRNLLSLSILLVIAQCSLPLNNELPSLSMPPAYKEERTEPTFSGSLRGDLIVRRPACPLQWW
jgi:hypothetical protein